MMNEKKNKLLLVGKVTFMTMALFLTVTAVKAFDLISEIGIFKGLTVQEFLQLKQATESPAMNNDEPAAGAIVMQEGQRNVTPDLLPDLNNDDSLGGFDRAFKNAYVSSTLYVGNPGDETVATSTFTKLAVGNAVGDFTINGLTVCLATGQNCTGVDSSAFWTYDNSIPGWYRASSTAEKQGLGTATPAAQLEVEGDQDIVQLLTEGHSTQTTDLFQGRQSNGNVVFSVGNTGHVAATGTLTIFGNLRAGTNNTSDLGYATSSWRNVYASGTLYLAGQGASTTHIYPITNNTYDLGGYTLAWKNIYASGTIFSNIFNAQTLLSSSSTLLAGISGTLGATSTIYHGFSVGNRTSFLSGGLTIDPSGNLRSSGTIDVGNILALGRLATQTSGTLYVDSGGNINSSGTLNLNGNSTFALGKTGANASGTFYVNQSGNVSASGSLTTFGNLLTGTNNTYNLGTNALAWGSLFASGTLHAAEVSLGGTNTSTTLKSGATATSTFSSALLVSQLSATSVLQIGRTGTAGQGACLSLASGDGSGNLYVFVAKGTLQLTTSTNSRDCY